MRGYSGERSANEVALVLVDQPEEVWTPTGASVPLEITEDIPGGAIRQVELLPGKYLVVARAPSCPGIALNVGNGRIGYAVGLKPGRRYGEALKWHDRWLPVEEFCERAHDEGVKRAEAGGSTQLDFDLRLVDLDAGTSVGEARALTALDWPGHPREKVAQPIESARGGGKFGAQAVLSIKVQKVSMLRPRVQSAVRAALGDKLKGADELPEPLTITIKASQGVGSAAVELPVSDTAGFQAYLGDTDAGKSFGDAVAARPPGAGPMRVLLSFDSDDKPQLVILGDSAPAP